MSALRMSPSPDWLEDMEPLARTKPASPVGARWWMKCCTQAKLALPAGGVPCAQRLSSAQPLAAPVAVVERRVGQDEVGPQVGVQIAVEGVVAVVAEVGVDAPQGEVHLGQPPSGGVVALLAVDADVADAAAVGLNELLALHEHAARAAAGVVDAALVRGQHLDQQAHHAARRVELAALLALGAGELAEEVFVDAAEDVLRPAAASPRPMVPIRSTSSPSRCLSSWGRA